MTMLAAPSQQNFLLHNIDWGTYESLLRTVGERHVFITYNQGNLELMSPSWHHDNRSEKLGQLIRTLGEEMNVELIGGGSATFRREDLVQGLEPDKCFYIQHVGAVRGKRDLDLSVDPPPDLCVEVEISRRLLDRVEIYARLGVPELWRDDGLHVRIYILKAGGYVPAPQSQAFRDIDSGQLDRLLEVGHGLDDTSWTRAMRQWLKTHLKP